MNIWTSITKGFLGALTFLVAFITPQMVLGLIPDSIENMTVGALVAAIVVAITNILKNWGKK